MDLQTAIRRRLKNQPLRETARQTGVAASTLCRVRQGKRQLSADAMQRLIDHFRLELRAK